MSKSFKAMVISISLPRLFFRQIANIIARYYNIKLTFRYLVIRLT